MELQTFVNEFADALATVDHSAAEHKHFQPGIGPFGEAPAVREALAVLQKTRPSSYLSAAVKRQPDLIIPGEWAIEFKIIRPFGDNGKPAEHWSENILHPYPGNTSSLGDCLKLIDLNIIERKAVVIFGYEHQEVRISLNPAIMAFELMAQQVMGITLGPRVDACRYDLIHPVLRVFGYQVHNPVP